eukprot:SAG31_NODE_4657_length_3064_cov_1.947049_2_plen_290_part_00
MMAWPDSHLQIDDDDRRGVPMYVQLQGQDVQLVRIRRKDTIKMAKEKIKKKLQHSIRSYDQKLTFKDIELQDNETVQSYMTKNGLKQHSTLQLSNEEPPNPDINLEGLCECINDQVAIRGEVGRVVGLLFVVSVVVFVLVEQLDTEYLFMTAASAGSVLENAGEGAGMDENSIASISSERAIWNWLKFGLLPAVQGRSWLPENAYQFSSTHRTNCKLRDDLTESCSELTHPNYSLPIHKYDIPMDDSQMRKYNMLIGGVKIEQRRAPFEPCPDKPFTKNFPGYKVTSWA